jgi:CPA2 family monovalent cation:H+ antiporter-2
VVQPELEAALEMMRQGLIHLNLPVDRVYEYADRVRRARGSIPDASGVDYLAFVEHLQNEQLQGTKAQVGLAWTAVDKESPLAGRTLASAAIRTRTGASVVAVTRAGEVQPNPDADFEIRAGDVVGVMGTPVQRRAFLDIAQAPTTEAV